MNILNHKYLTALLFALIIFSSVLSEKTLAQSNTYKRTPAALAPGTPTGSYALNGLENVNLYNGNLNFSLPLLQIGGRGNAGYAITLPIEHRWRVNRFSDGLGNDIYTPLYDWWTQAKPGYSPGVVQARQTAGECQQYGYPTETNTNLTFTTTDGTEIELKDTIAYGEPQSSICPVNYPANGVSRGTTFVSKDGSHLTFVSDTIIYDLVGSNTTSPFILSPSGYLMFKDGTRYRIDNGAVSWIQDRNGNRIIFSYNNTQPPYSMTATDSLNRQVTVQYNVNEVSPYGICDKITFKGNNGATRIVRISKNSLSAALKSGETLKTYAQLFPIMTPNWTTGNVNPDNLVSSVWLPDGRRYQFFYNSYADLAKIVLPTGGVIEYDWWGSDNYNAIYRRVSERRSYPDGITLESKTVYDVPNYSNPNPIVVRHLAADGTQLSVEKHYFYGNAWAESTPLGPYQVPPDWNVGREFETEAYSADGVSLLRETTQTWYQDTPTWWSPYGNSVINNPRIIETTLKLADTNQVSKQTFSYDQFNNQTDVYEYDYGAGAAGAFKRRTHTDFVTDTNYTSQTGAHLRSLPLQTWVSSDINGSNKASLTQFEYDNYTTDTNHAALVSRSNITGFNSTNFGTNYTQRGNATAVTSYGNAQTQTGPISVYSQYDILGNVVKTIDAKGYVSTIDYSDRFGSPDNEARSNTAPTQLNGQSTFAFATSATNALGWVTGYSQFDYYTGAGVDAEDINGVVSSSFYNDALDRSTQTIVANNISNLRRQTTIEYDDVNRKVTTTADLFAFGDNLSKAESYYDGLGRTIESRKYEENGNYVAVQTQYDALGRAYKASNPFRPNEINTNNSIRWATSKFDALGRVIEVEATDGTKALTAYSGNAVTATDASGRQGRSITNAPGQLTRIDEPDINGNLGTISSPTQPTFYKYDTVGKMVEVTQGLQKRYFLYDDLGRLLRVRQPEQIVNTALNLSDAVTGNSQWTAGFTYDNNGNVLTATDAKNLTITNLYDNLNRVLTRSYSDGTTPTVNYLYDDPNVPFSKGKLTKVANSISTSQTTAFDILGRSLTYQQITDGQTYTSSYQYNLSGALVQETYPSGRVVKNEFESDGDLQRIFGNATNQTEKTYANGFVYTADGKIQRLRLGNGRWESAKFNSRLQVTELALGSSNGDGGLWKLAYEYGELNTDGTTVNTTKNTGNIAKQTVSFSGLAQPFVQTYKYDSLYRLTEARETSGSNQTWKQTFGYDRFGNRTAFSQIIGSTQLVLDNRTFPQIDANTNRFTTGQGYTYDFNGNLVTDADGRQFTFNGDNKQTLVKDVNNNVVGTYFYDGDGKRVKKVTNLETTTFVYSGGKLIAEYSTAVPTTNPTTNYTATDQLGSPRVITNALGQVTSRRDFLPFGEELFPDGTYRKTSDKYGAVDSVRQRFTSYQKDTETGLDFAEARYYNNKHGRFTAVDPLLASGKSANPQTFNRFVYTMNRPLILTDKSGLQAGSDENEVVARIYTIWNSITNAFYEAVKSRTDYLLNGATNIDPLDNANFQRVQNRVNVLGGSPDAAEGLSRRLVGNQGPTVDSVLQQTKDTYENARTTAEYGFLAQNLLLGAAGMVGPGSASVTTNRGIRDSIESCGNR